MATKITRPEEGRIVGGVCQGIANAFDLDPTIVRIVAAVLILAAGSGPLIYLVLWVIIPDERSGASIAGDAARKARDKQESRRSGNTWNFNQTTAPHRPDETFSYMTGPAPIDRYGRCHVLEPSHSHSMVAGGFEVMSRTTRLICGQALVIRVEIFSSTS